MTVRFGRRDGPSALGDLGRIVAELSDLRVHSHKARYGDGPPLELPLRTATVEIVEGLSAALFPRHFGPSGLTGDGLDAFATFVLTRALQSLQRQVRLELELTAPKIGDELRAAETRARRISPTGLPTICLRSARSSRPTSAQHAKAIPRPPALMRLCAAIPA
jgi:hypothetical protein